MLKEAAGLASAVKANAVREKVIEVQSKLGEVMIALNEQIIQNHSLLDELRKVKDALSDANKKLKSKEDTKPQGNVLWVRDDPNPLCLFCHDKDGKDIRLLRRPDEFFCRGCGTRFGQPQPPADFGIEQIQWPPEEKPPPRQDDDERGWRRMFH
jgi:hypothetical protein